MLLWVGTQTTSAGQSPVTRSSLANLTQYVDPFIGTGFHGHVFMGANVPFGAVQLGPTQMSEGWDWSSGYHESDSLLIGFAHTHLSGTGIGDLGDILFMPTTGPVKVTKGTAQNSQSGYASRFDHADEKARPGYYAVKLKRYGIGVELTATERVGFHRYTFPTAAQANIIIDLEEGIGWDRATATHLKKINDSTLAGYRYSSGWAERQRIYFSAVFSQPIHQLALFDDQTPVSGDSASGVSIKGVISFATQAGDQVTVKVGISPVSSENAFANIQSELPHWNFNRVAAEADAAWNQELNKLLVRTTDQARLKTFYTAFYHTMIAPSTFNDYNGEYRGTNGQVYRQASFRNLTTFSLWDTYRAAHPLFTLLQPRRVNDMISSMLAIYQQQGKLPIWHLVGNETYTMPGNSAIPVVADACLKGFSGFDSNLAYEAMKASAMLDERGLKFVKERGYIPADDEAESVAKGLEYAIDDWCLAQVAKKLGRTDDYTYFQKRAKNYQLYFDPKVGFMRGRISDDTWRTPFDPFQSEHRKDDFAEGNAWQYTWLVPQDVEGLVSLLGGETRFSQKLDSLFLVKGNLGDGASADITGLIGQYAHGNEPSHHITYLYPYVGQPGKTARKVRYILDSLYSARPDGLCGNEDVGQLSAWAIFSSLGFYPVSPANGAYVFGSPVFDEATLDVGDGKVFHILVRNNSKDNIYIQRMTLNGQPYTKAYLRHQDIVNGGELVIDMGSQESTTWGRNPADRPSSDYTANSQPFADLSLTLLTDRRHTKVGDLVSMSLRLRNSTAMSGPVSATWEHRLPPNVVFAGGAGLTYSDGIVTGGVAKLHGQADTTFRFQVRPLAAGTYRSAAQIMTASMPDPDSKPGSGTGDGEDDAALTDFRTRETRNILFVSPNPNQTVLPAVQPNQPVPNPASADLSLRMNVSNRTPVVNEIVSYTLVVSNAGGQAVHSIQLTDELPTNLSLINKSDWSVNGSSLTRTVGPIAAGASVSVLVQARVMSKGLLLNRAQISTATVADPDSTPGNGYANGEDDTTVIDSRVRD